MLDLPQPPTDNLYKFVAIFGLVLFLAAGLLSWAQVQQHVVIASEIEHLSRQIAHNLSLPDSGILDTARATRNASPGDNAKIARLNQLKETSADSVAPFWILIALSALAGASGVALMIKGFRLWYDRAQIYQDQVLKAQAENDAKKLEEARSELSKTVAVHKVQAELEVTAYQEIWEKLAALDRSVAKVRPYLGMPIEDEAARDELKPLMTAANADFRAFVAAVEKHRPFYAPDVYHQLTSLREQISFEWIDSVVGGSQGVDVGVMARQVSNAERVRANVEACSDAIRARLANMTVA